MKIINRSLILGTAALLTLGSCKRYLDINDDPNNIPAELATPTLIFPAAVSETYRTQGIQIAQFAGLMMNSFAGNSYSYGTPFVDDYSFNLTPAYYGSIWDNLYRGIANYQLIINFNDSEGKYTKAKAAARIMKAYYFQIITDLYNDAPYSEFGKGQGNLRPKYDKAEDIYRASLADINKAIDDLEGDSADIDANSDIIFHGNATKWVAFGNTLKLRYLMRMSKVTGTMATLRDAELASLSGASFITADVMENPGYSSASLDKQNPFTSNFIIQPGPARPGNYTLVVPSENMAAALNGNVGNGVTANSGQPLTDAFHTKFTGIVDGRRGRIFTRSAATGNVEGVRQGSTPGQPGAESGRTAVVSRLGQGLYQGATATTTPQQSLDVGSAYSGTLMTLAEAKFLLAEAAITFPQYFSNGQANFEAGVTASFTRLGATGAAAYITAINARPRLGWTGSNDEKLDAIMTQKWIALTGVNEEQSYFDYSKTGYPAVPTSTLATKNRPYRLIYPSSEYGTNAANVPNITAADIFTKNAYTPFWNRN